MTDVPEAAVRLALAARSDLLADRPDPMVLSEETLTRRMLEAAMPAIERDIRARIACEIDPDRLDLLADWMDHDDAAHGRNSFPEVQADLRRWAKLLRKDESSDR